MWALARLEPVRSIASLFYPPYCVICAADVEPDSYLCDTCSENAPRIRAPFCATCSEPFSGAITDTFVCANCAHRSLHFEAAVAAYRSRGIVRRLVHQFKYGHQQHLRHPIAEWLGETLSDPRLRGRHFDAIVPVPLHSTRERECGFNQAAQLVELLSKRTGIPVRNALLRMRYTIPQTAYDRQERMENLKDAFCLRKNADVRGSRMLLVDDVLTTGSTLSDCARVLKHGGVLSVHAATAARA